MSDEEDFGIEEFVADVLSASRIERETLTQLSSSLQSADGFLDSARVAQIVQRHCGEGTDAVAAWRLVLGLRDWLADSQITTEILVRIVESDESTDSSSLDREHLGFVIESLAGPFPALERQANASRVSNAAGSRAIRLEFVCDLRPVFDTPKREVIEGLLPLTTMHLEARNAADSQSVMEALLSEQDLRMLIAEAQVAVRKIERMRELVERSNLPVPSVSLTIRGDDAEATL